jgi:ATPase subunit of ABC transporter with duplicated ATPase domains
LGTKEYVTQGLKEYPEAMMIIPHDSAFLEDIGITHYYKL